MLRLVADSSAESMAAIASTSGVRYENHMKVSELIEALQRAKDEYGDRQVGVIMDKDQKQTATEITEISPFTIPGRSEYLVIDCASIYSQVRRDVRTADE